MSPSRSSKTEPDVRDIRDGRDIRAVVLDLGGVILDLGPGRGRPHGEQDQAGRSAMGALLRARGGRLPSSATSWGQALDRLLFTPWQEGYEHRYAGGREEPWGRHLERLRQGTGSTATDAELLGAWFRPFGATVPALPGATGALTALRDAGLRVGLLSNVPLPGFLYREILEHHRLLSPFDHLRFSYDAGVRKPRPEALAGLLEILGVEPAAAVMVGDRRDADVVVGREVGAGTVWVTTGRRGPAEDDGPEPDVAIEGVGELPTVLRELWGLAIPGGR